MKLISTRLALCLVLLVAAVRAETTETILARMDKTAPAFKGVSADLKMTTYTKILADNNVEAGTLQMQRMKSKDTRAVIDFSAASDARILTFEGKSIRIFYPKLNEYNEVGLGKNGNVLNQFLLLGFGSSGTELAANYEISNENTEKVGSVNCTKLLLVPKSSEVKERIQKVEIWIAEGATYPIQQQFYQPSGNYQLVLYSNVVLNPVGQKIQYKMPANAHKQRK